MLLRKISDLPATPALTSCALIGRWPCLTRTPTSPLLAVNANQHYYPAVGAVRRLGFEASHAMVDAHSQVSGEAGDAPGLEST